MCKSSLLPPHPSFSSLPFSSLLAHLPPPSSLLEVMGRLVAIESNKYGVGLKDKGKVMTMAPGTEAMPVDSALIDSGLNALAAQLKAPGPQSTQLR